MNIKNKENFIEWLGNNCKADIVVDANYIFYTLEELKRKHEETGNTIFELSKIETKSKRPEVFYYNVEYSENENGEIETIYIF